ncbi:glycosyltransferase [Gluconobacter cerinus]|uniref:glycosyltransferase family 2 protein n=1 Tax=Gluconobacter cerinus TaxID=38307 RepID=UPI001B8BA989|nr:glycosyltransferase [Gluconobacter cerinus]MBS1019386.1 glycosyltransferase [Gluconobacter cerinus]
MTSAILQLDDEGAQYEFVVRAYGLILRRAADRGGIHSGVAFLANGGEPEAFIRELLASEEFHNLRVSPDPRELCVNYWDTIVERHNICPAQPMPALEPTDSLVEALLHFLTCPEVRQLPLDQGVLRCNDLRAYRYWRSLVAPGSYKNDRPQEALLPPISFVVRVDRDLPSWEEELQGLFASLQAQTTLEWRLLVLADRFSLSACRSSLGRDRRVSLIRTARDIKTTGWIAVLNADDRLEPDACARMSEALAFAPHAGLAYADEDIRDQAGYRDPWIKEEWIRYKAYTPRLTGLVFFRRDLSERLFQEFLGTGTVPATMVSGYLRTDQVLHVPAVLVHRARPISGGMRPALLRVPTNLPSVSIIIPTKDKPELIRRVLEALFYRTNYSRLDIVVVDNGTTDKDAQSVLRKAERRENVTVVNAPGPFNWSYLNNLGVSHSRGEVVVLLNNDVDVISASWLEYLVSPLKRQDIGVTGAVLLFSDGTVQHAGIDLEVGPKARHVGLGETFPADPEGTAADYDVPAVTGACLAIRRTLFDEIGGLDEALPVTWNDIDLCLRARRAKQRVVIATASRLLHDESSTRLPDMDVSQRQVVRNAHKLIHQRYGSELGAWKSRNAQIEGFGPYEFWSLEYAKKLRSH